MEERRESEECEFVEELGRGEDLQPLQRRQIFRRQQELPREELRFLEEWGFFKGQQQIGRREELREIVGRREIFRRCEIREQVEIRRRSEGEERRDEEALNAAPRPQCRRSVRVRAMCGPA